MQKQNFVILFIFLFSCAFINSNLLRKKIKGQRINPKIDSDCYVRIYDDDSWWSSKDNIDTAESIGNLPDDVEEDVKYYECVNNLSHGSCYCKIEAYYQYNYKGTKQERYGFTGYNPNTKYLKAHGVKYNEGDDLGRVRSVKIIQLDHIWKDSYFG